MEAVTAVPLLFLASQRWPAPPDPGAPPHLPPQLFTTSPFESITVHEAPDDPVQRRYRGAFVEVSKRSHAYLQQALWDRQPGSYTHNVSARYEPADEAAVREVSGHPKQRVQ